MGDEDGTGSDVNIGGDVRGGCNNCDGVFSMPIFDVGVAVAVAVAVVVAVIVANDVDCGIRGWVKVNDGTEENDGAGTTIDAEGETIDGAINGDAVGGNNCEMKGLELGDTSRLSKKLHRSWATS